MIQATFYIGHDVDGVPYWCPGDFKAWASKWFPDGFTILPAVGGYKGETETTTVLVLIVPEWSNTPQSLSEIKAELATYFMQSQVFAFWQTVQEIK